MEKKTLDVAGCVIEHEGKVLVLRRAKEYAEPDTLGLPAGKIDEGETPKEAVIREVMEETGISLDDPEFIYTDLWDVGKKIIRYSTFFTRLKGECPEVILDPEEHSDFLWITPKELYKREDNIHGLDDVLEKVYKVKDLE